MDDFHIGNCYFTEPAFLQFLIHCGLIEKRDAAAIFHQLFDQADASGFHQSGKAGNFQTFHFQIAFQDIPGAGAGFPGDKPVLQQFLDGMGAGSKGIIRTADANVPLSGIELMVVNVSWKIPLHQSKINVSFVQLLQKCFGVVHRKERRTDVVLAQISCNAPGDFKFRNGERQSHFQRRFLIEGFLHFFLQIQNVVIYGSSCVFQQDSCGCQLQFFALIKKKRRSQFLFQPADVLRHGRLCQVQPLSGPGVIHVFTYLKKGFNPEIQHIVFLISYHNRDLQ